MEKLNGIKSPEKLLELIQVFFMGILSGFHQVLLSCAINKIIILSPEAIETDS